METWGLGPSKRGQRRGLGGPGQEGWTLGMRLCFRWWVPGAGLGGADPLPCARLLPSTRSPTSGLGTSEATSKSQRFPARHRAHTCDPSSWPG